MNSFRLTFLLLTTTVIASRANGQTPDLLGTVTLHNGSLASDPPGTGQVQVDLTYGNLTYGPHRAVYRENATHRVEYTYAPGPAAALFNRSYLWNGSGVAWSGFEICLEGADFAGWSRVNPMQVRGQIPVVEVPISGHITDLETDIIGLEHPALSAFSLSDSSISRFNDVGSGFRDSLLTLTFDDPVLPNRGFVLWYGVIHSPGAPTASGFTGYLTPIPVPEPASLILAALAATPTLLRRRRTV